VTRLRPSDCRATLASFQDWLDGWRPTAGEHVPETQRRSIDMIWVLKRSRGGNIAWTLVEAMAEHLGIAVGELAHSLPFTEAAVRFWTKRGLTDIYLA
jgi:hypothetical protein